MRFTKAFTSLAVAGVLAVGASACGGNEDAPAADRAMTSSKTASTSSGAPSPKTPAADLRVTLDRLLGEHAHLAIAATQKGYAGQRDFKQVAAALDRNSVELADAIGSVYGPDAREEFLNGGSKWRDHIGFFVDYTVAKAKNDQAGQKQAVRDLMGYVASFSTFLAKATGLPQSALQKTITTHVMQLKGQLDAYAAGDHGKSARFTRDAYAHMFMTGDTLAGAIVEQSPDDFR
ncbi:MAG TPA: hypothetical protein VG079_05180 [Gaiellaceae bacterium]|nr:hypothetical protein [Gaiellaceae bacterium]